MLLRPGSRGRTHDIHESGRFVLLISNFSHDLLEDRAAFSARSWQQRTRYRSARTEQRRSIISVTTCRALAQHDR